MELYTETTRDAVLASRPAPDETFHGGGLDAFQYGDVTLVFAHLANDERAAHLAGEHSLYAHCEWEDGAKNPRPFHKRDQRAEVFARSSRGTYTFLGGGRTGVHQATSGGKTSLVIQLIIPPPPTPALVELGIFAPRRMIWLASHDELDEDAVDEAIGQLRETLAVWLERPHVKTSSVKIVVLRGGARLATARGPTAPADELTWRGRTGGGRNAYSVTVRAESPDLPSIAAYDDMEQTLRGHPVTYRESAQLLRLGVGARPSAAFVQTCPRLGFRFRYAQNDTKRPTHHFKVDEAREDCRVLGHYAASGKRIVDPALALSAFRAFLVTGEPAGLHFPRGVRFEDAMHGLPTL